MPNNKIKTAKLAKKYLGFSENARVLFVENSSMAIGLIIDEKDEQWGYYIDTDIHPELKDITDTDPFPSEESFWIIYKLISQGFLKLPKNFSFKSLFYENSKS